MTDNATRDSTIDRAGEQLFQFAIDRSDMQSILDVLPLDVPEKRVALEYEIQLLRIISVGWAITYFLTERGLKRSLEQLYWEHVRAFSSTLSTSASMTMGADIDYFDILKQRLDFYVQALDSVGQISQPAMAVGPAFADVCGDKEDAVVTLAGSKMFSHTILAVREYLDDITAQQDQEV